MSPHNQTGIHTADDNWARQHGTRTVRVTTTVRLTRTAMCIVRATVRRVAPIVRLMSSTAMSTVCATVRCLVAQPMSAHLRGGVMGADGGGGVQGVGHRARSLVSLCEVNPFSLLPGQSPFWIDCADIQLKS